MGFSLVATAAIIGVAVVMSIEILVGTTIPTITDIHDSYDQMKDRAIEQVQTDINVTNSVQLANGSSHYDLIFTVKNTGSVSLETQKFDVLVNGTKKTFSVQNSYLHPENQLLFRVDYLGRDTDINFLKIVAENGISEYYSYRGI